MCDRISNFTHSVNPYFSPPLFLFSSTCRGAKLYSASQLHYCSLSNIFSICITRTQQDETQCCENVFLIILALYGQLGVRGQLEAFVWSEFVLDVSIL